MPLVNRRRIAVLSILLLTLPGCAGIESTIADLQASVDDIDINEVMGNLTDCDELSDAFVDLVKTTADKVDEFAETSGATIPIGELRAIVDELAVSRYYEIGERLGCAKLQMQLQLVDKLVQLDAETASGEDFLDEVLDEVQLPTT